MNDADFNKLNKKLGSPNSEIDEELSNRLYDIVAPILKLDALLRTESQKDANDTLSMIINNILLMNCDNTDEILNSLNEIYEHSKEIIVCLDNVLCKE